MTKWDLASGMDHDTMLVCDFRGAGAVDIEHEADVLAVGCLELIVHPHNDDGTFRTI